MKSIKLMFLCVFIFGVSFGFSVEKKAFEIEDLYKLKSISGLSLSEDGKNVVFSIGTSKLKKGKSYSDIYSLNIRTSEIKRLTFNEKSDFHPFFSPDSRFIYFISTRKDGAQLWRMAVNGGEAEQITSFSSGISSPVLSDDGKTLYFSSSVFPECGADSDCNKKMSKKLNNGPTQGHLGKELLFRHWTTYRDWQYSHIFKMDIKTAKVIAITEGKTDYPSYGGNFVLSPDSKEICTTINFDKDKAMSTNSDLYTINLDSNKRKNITKKNFAFDGSPEYSPNGKYIAYRLQEKPNCESDRFKLAVYDISKDKIRVLTESIDNWVTSFKWSKDSKNIYFTIYEKGKIPIYRVKIKSGKIKKVLEHSYIREFSLTKDGKSIIYSRSSIGEPYEIWKYNLKTKKKPIRLTFFNKNIEDKVDIRKGESVWINGADNKKIHCFIVKPHGFDPAKKYPLIINVHGGPQYQWADSFRGDWQVYPGSGYVVAFPNPHGSTGYGQDFTNAISKDYNGKVMKDIAMVTDYLAKLSYIDEDKIGAMGWSWGGYAMMWLEGNSSRYKALVSMMGIFDLKSMYLATEELWFTHYDNGGAPWENKNYYEQASPSNYVKNFKTPCLIITGERDYRVPYTQSLQFFTALQRMGVASEIIVFSNDGHWPNNVKSMPVYYNAHLEWFAIYLGGKKAPYSTEKMLRNIEFKTDE